MANIDSSSSNLEFDLSSLNNDLDGTLLKEKGSNQVSLTGGKTSGTSPAKRSSTSSCLDDATTSDASTMSDDAATSTSDSSSSDSSVPPYTPVTPMSTLEEQYSWVTDASVEDVSYVLIVLVDMIFVMSYYSLQLNDVSNIMATETPMTSDLTTIANELSTLQSSITYDSDTDSYVSNGSFTEEDATQLSDAVTDLFLSDSNTSLTWDDMAIEWDGSTYYMQPDGTWSNTAYDGDAYGVTGDSSVSDAGLYEFANAVYAVDTASYTGGTLDTSEVFPTESPYENANDPVMSSLGQLWDALTKSIKLDPDEGDYGSLMGAIYSYNNTGSTYQLEEVLDAYGEQYANSMQNGGGSQLTDLISLTNNALTQVGNVSTQQTNEIQQLTQELQTMDQLAQTIIQDATQANANMVNHQTKS